MARPLSSAPVPAQTSAAVGAAMSESVVERLQTLGLTPDHPDALDNLDLSENTYVIYTTDNGPWLPAGSAHPLSGGKYTTMEGGHRVPFIARWPEKIAAGAIDRESLISAVDLLPTFCELAGAEFRFDTPMLSELMALIEASIEELEAQT